MANAPPAASQIFWAATLRTAHCRFCLIRRSHQTMECKFRLDLASSESSTSILNTGNWTVYFLTAQGAGDQKVTQTTETKTECHLRSHNTAQAPGAPGQPQRSLADIIMDKIRAQQAAKGALPPSECVLLSLGTTSS